MTRTKLEDCEQCDGRGWIMAVGRATCPTCSGVGNFEVSDFDEPHTTEEETS